MLKKMDMIVSLHVTPFSTLVLYMILFCYSKLDRQLNEHRKESNTAESSAKPLRVKISDSFWPHARYSSKKSEGKKMLNAMLFCIAIILSSSQKPGSPRWQTTKYIIWLHRLTEFNQRSERNWTKNGCEKTRLRNESSCFVEKMHGKILKREREKMRNRMEETSNEFI